MGNKRWYGIEHRRIVFLNCRIITTEGKYNCVKTDLETVKKVIQDKKFLSAIGHKSTATILSTLLDIEIPVNRIKYEQAFSDVAIVFQLKDRIPEGKILSQKEIKEIGYDFYFLYRIINKQF